MSTTLTGKLHYYHPFMLLGALLLTVGSGMLTTMHPESSLAKWIGYEILAGAGTGFGTALPLLAVQDALQPSDVSIGFAVVLTAGYLASSIALAVAEAVFVSQLKRQIRNQIPGVDPESIIATSGTTDLRNLLPKNLYEQGLQVYSTALTHSWYISVILAGVSVPLVLGLKWKKIEVKKHN
jgi:hypothetical protein